MITLASGALWSADLDSDTYLGHLQNQRRCKL